MPKSGQTVAQKIRQERRDSLRELLRAQGHEQHVLDLLGKLSDLDQELDNIEVQRISKVIDAKMKIINKYLPDDKEPTDLNIGGQEDNPLTLVIAEISGKTLGPSSE